MSPLMIILLMLILVIGSVRQIAGEKSTVARGNQSFPGNDDQNSTLLNRVNYVTVSVGRNDRDPSTTRRNRLRQDLQHLLSSMVKKIIQQRRIQAKRANVTMNEKVFGKTVEGNKIPVGEFPEDNALDRGVETERAGNYKNIIGRRSGSEVREKLSKDLFQVSEALMPTFWRIARSRLQTEVQGNHKEEMKPRLNEGNSSKAEQNSRVKRDSAKDESNNTAVWIKKDFTGHENNLKMHAFIVKDEEIPPCCSPAKQVTNRRYFMCSGSVLTLKHVITSASCVHYADIYESHVRADLAVLIGGTEPRAYVIKINRYEMHPDYDYDVDSRNYATNNLAVLYLACSIVAQDVSVPSLPKGVNDDVAHMCCREGCDLITIMESSNNRITARILPAKHLPAPRHDDEDAPSYRDLSNSALQAVHEINKPVFSNESFIPTRRIRSPLKLAAAPNFFGKESRRFSKLQGSGKSVESPKKRKKAKSARKSSTKNQQRDRKKKPLNFDDFINRGRSGRAYIPIMRALEAQGVNVEEQLSSIDWQKLEDTVGNKFSENNREKMDIFAKNVVDETMKRLDNVLGDGGESGDEDSTKMDNGTGVFKKLMPNGNKNKTIEDFVHVFTKVVSSIIVPSNGGQLGITLDTSLEEKDLKDPPPSNEECPPIGSPVFANGTLVGLLAYTCDDVQTWVEWKYVNIAKNINWIRKQMTTEYGTVGLCPGSEQHVRPSLRSLPDYPHAISGTKKLPKESEPEIRGRRVEWKRRETTSDLRRSSSTGNLDHARNPAMGTYPRIPKDPWFARNSPLAPRAQREYERQRIFTDSLNRPQSPARNAPVYNVNTCYVRPDGSTDCQTRSDFRIP